VLLPGGSNCNEDFSPIIGKGDTLRAIRGMVLTMRRSSLALVLMMTTFMSGCHGYHQLVPLRNIPAGSVLQEFDFRRGRCWTLFGREDYAEDLSRVVGHRALKALHAGSDFHMTDISQ
jgi:hypothetical protein